MPLQRARDIVQRWRSRDAAEALAAFADYAALRRKKRAAEVLFRQRRGRQVWSGLARSVDPSPVDMLCT